MNSSTLRAIAAEYLRYKRHCPNRDVSTQAQVKKILTGDFCEKCGAWRGHYGLEPTVKFYIEHTVTVFEEVRRVLRDDGLLFLNIGDSYASTGGHSDKATNHRIGQYNLGNRPEGNRRDFRQGAELKPKDMCLVPQRMAIALQDAGWYIRCDIIWEKGNPMPESTKDRPTKSHEYVWMCSKSEKYFYDNYAIREPVTWTSNPRGKGVNPKARHPTGWATGQRSHRELAGRYAPDKQSGHGRRHAGFNARYKTKQNESFAAAVVGLVATRNKRSVWHVNTKPFKGAHFATFPDSLIRPMILAGTSARGCCPKCGAQWARVVEKGEPDLEHQRACGGDLAGEYDGKSTKDYSGAKAQDASATKARILAGMVKKETVGWKPTCACGGYKVRTGTSKRLRRAWYRQRWQQKLERDFGAPVPSMVFDPFGGSGTVGMVSLKEGRHATLIEIKPDYVGMINTRCDVTPQLNLN